MVFEIIPHEMTLSDTAHKWVAYLIAMGGGDWRPYFCENLSGAEQRLVNGQKLPGYMPFDVSIPDVISFIESALPSPGKVITESKMQVKVWPLHQA
jgi:hypothetical protein